MSQRPTLRALTVLLCVAAAPALVGCADGGRLWSFRNNPTPDMDNLAMSKEAHKNRDTVSLETNGRALHDDSARFWLTDRPSRLTPTRIPY